MSGVEDVENQGRSYKKPHNAHNPIPTIKGYRQEKERRQEQYGTSDKGGGQDAEDGSKRDRLTDAYNVFKHGRDADPANSDGPYPATNKNLVQDEEEADDQAGRVQPTQDGKPLPQEQDSQDTIEDTTEHSLQSSSDPKKARKEMKKFTADGTEREVTDPVTHLPVQIHDFTEKDLKSTAKNPLPVGSEPKTMTGMAGVNKSDERLAEEEQESKDAHKAMEVLFPPPEFDATRQEITSVYTQAVTVGLGAVAVSLMIVNTLFWPTRHSTGWTRQLFKVAELGTMLGVSGAIIIFMRQWSENKIKNVWDVEVWQAERKRGQKVAKSQTAESAQWLNSMFASIWPLINPDLFTSISDMLEVEYFRTLLRTFS